MDSYTVKAPLVVLPDPAGGPDRHLYGGTAVPDDVDEATRDRLVERGLIEAARVVGDGGSDDDAPPAVEVKPATKRRRHHASDDPA